MNISIKRDQIILKGILEKPKNISKCPIVILMHGFTSNKGMDNSSILYVLAQKLLDRNIASVRFDFNGLGESSGNLVDMTVENEIEDGKTILEYVKSLDFVSQDHIYILGHSQGGVVASMLAGIKNDSFKAVLLMAPAATLKDDALKGILREQKYDPSHIPEYVVLHKGGKELHIGRQYFQVAQKLKIYETAKQYVGPVYLIHGNQDKIVDMIASTRYHKVYKNSILNIMDGADHGFSGKYRKPAINAVLDFIDKNENL